MNSFPDVQQKLFRRLAQSFWARFSELQLRLHTNVFMKINLFQKFFSISFSHLRGIFFRLWKFFKGRVTKLLFTSPSEIIMENNFLRKYNSLKVYGFWAFSFGDWVKKFNRIVKNAHYVLEEPFEEKQLFWKKSNSKTFFGLWGESFQPHFEILFRHSR